MKQATAEPVQGVLAGLGRKGASLFAACCLERLRPALEHVPSGATPLVAGVALTELWRVLEEVQRPDPRRLSELSQACWGLVDIEPTPGVPTALLEMLVAATHHALQTYLSGNPQHAVQAAGKLAEAAAWKAQPTLSADEAARQERDLRDIAEAVRSGAPLAAFGTRLRERAEQEGKILVAALLDG
ncbi:MAG: hypothetical protein NVS2B9_07150 [Myxococcales bacterium]